MMSFSKKLDIAVKNSGFISKTLAAKLDEMGYKISKESITKYRSGARTPDPEFVKYACKALNIEPNFLYSDTDSLPSTKMIPIIGEASCGVPMGHILENNGYDYYPAPVSNGGKHTYLVRAVGDSMEPKISEGDLCIVDPEVHPENGQIAHYTINGEDSGIKQYYISDDGATITLLPLNPSYEPIRIFHYDNVDIRLARVLSVVKKL
jgi:repressor LexA